MAASLVTLRTAAPGRPDRPRGVCPALGQNLLLQGPAFEGRPLWLSLTASEIVALAAVSGLLWSRRPLSMKTLRIVELTIFNMVAAFFAWLQWNAFYDGAFLRGSAGGGVLVFGQVAKALALRWFLLIVLYGTLFPTPGGAAPRSWGSWR